MTSKHESSMRLKDQVAIVTGVSHEGQVGFALASAMAREGSMLAISSRTSERVNARTEELRAEGAQVVAVPADLTTCFPLFSCCLAHHEESEQRQDSQF